MSISKVNPVMVTTIYGWDGLPERYFLNELTTCYKTRVLKLDDNNYIITHPIYSTEEMLMYLEQMDAVGAVEIEPDFNESEVA